jgi:hypothetical protein
MYSGMWDRGYGWFSKYLAHLYQVSVASAEHQSPPNFLYKLMQQQSYNLLNVREAGQIRQNADIAIFLVL